MKSVLEWPLTLQQKLHIKRQRQNPELCDLCVGHFIPGTSHKTSHYGDALTQSD